MKINKEIDITLSDIKEYINDASGFDVREIYDYAKSEGGIDDHCDECENREISADLGYVVESIPSYNDRDVRQIYNAAAEELRFFKIENLADQMKIEFINSIWDKYTLEQLEQKLI